MNHVATTAIVQIAPLKRVKAVRARKGVQSASHRTMARHGSLCSW